MFLIMRYMDMYTMMAMLILMLDANDDDHIIYYKKQSIFINVITV